MRIHILSATGGDLGWGHFMDYLRLQFRPKLGQFGDIEAMMLRRTRIVTTDVDVTTPVLLPRTKTMQSEGESLRL